MNAKQRRFAEEYVVDLNATQAAIRAGYSDETAGQQAHMLLKNVEIQKSISDLQDKLSAKTEITAANVLKELAKIGFSDMRKAVKWAANVTAVVHDEDGNERLAVTNQVILTDSADLDEETAACISEISQTATGALKIKFYDKRAALVDIGKHLGMFIDRNAQVNGAGEDVQVGALMFVPVKAKDGESDG